MSLIAGLCEEGLKIVVFNVEGEPIFETVIPFEAVLTMLQWWAVFNG